LLLKDEFAAPKTGGYLCRMLQVSGLYIYPIKSTGGISVNKAHVTDRGFEHDRRWMIVDESNRFISQREVASMALMQVNIMVEGLHVTFLARSCSFVVPFQPQTAEFAQVTVWDDTCLGQFVSSEADKWFSDMLDINCRLVYMPDETRRITDQRYTPESSITSFSDAYPFLMIGQASLDDLNSRLKDPILMNRFRPNIVFSGGEPYGEDMMHTFYIGEIEFYGVKLCARCPIPTIDQDSLQRGKEPLKTLAGYRFKNNKIMFGQNLVHNGTGEIAVGDALVVLKLNYAERFLVND
jgi:uncharacterized protein YcbX